MRPGKRSHRRCWAADDGDDCVDGDDDDASVPVDAWFREMVRGLCHVIPAEGDCRSAGTDALSSRFPTLEAAPLLALASARQPHRQTVGSLAWLFRIARGGAFHQPVLR